MTLVETSHRSMQSQPRGNLNFSCGGLHLEISYIHFK
jgi:hypothetical protein